ncbi:MAG: LytR C-terminal domain-containing protein, partial [Minisyncoccia bacterium]
MSKVKPKDLIYPAIVLFFIIIVGILFSVAIKFITKNFNDAFSGTIVTERSTLNIANYTIVAKKLGISIEQQKNTIVTAPEEATATTTENLVVEPPLIIDKKSITISVLNSTTKKGVAGVLAQALETDGFAKATTGNEKKQYATTTIFINEGKLEYEKLILDIVQKAY